MDQISEVHALLACPSIGMCKKAALEKEEEQQRVGLKLTGHGLRSPLPDLWEAKVVESVLNEDPPWWKPVLPLC